jgi:YVTN family beta-propeller protein
MLRIALVVLASIFPLCAAQDVLLVLLKGASALGYYTLEGKMLGKVDVGRHPHEMVISPDGKFAYITDNGTMRIEQAGKGGNTVSIVDIAARKRVDTISTGKYHRPHGISYDPVRNYLAVTAENPDRLILMDAKRRKVLRTFDPEGKTSHMVSFGPGDSGAEYAFVSNSGAHFVSVVQLTTGATKTIPTGQRPEGSILSRDGKLLFVANRESSSITVIDTARQAALGDIATGKGPVRLDLTPDGRMLIAALMHEHAVGFVDLATRREVARVAVEGDPVSISVSPDGQYAFASSEEKDLVHVISVADRKLVRSFPTEKGAGPDPAILVSVP